MDSNINNQQEDLAKIAQDQEQFRITQEMMMSGKKTGKRGWLIVLAFLLIIAALFLSANRANAQRRVTFQSGAFYQNCKLNEATCHHIGLNVGASFEPFFPWPVYLETGLSAGVFGDLKSGAGNYRFELPLNLTWQWEPSPLFSVGPYVGVNGALNWKVEGNKTFFTWGAQAGISIRPSFLYINLGYYRDFVPYVGTTSMQQGIRFALGVCF